MPALPSDPPVHLLALRVTLAFAGAITLSEAFDHELSFVAALAAATLALGPAISVLSVVTLPVLAWTILNLAVILLEAFAPGLLPFYLIVLTLCLWLGFALSTRPDGTQVVGLLILVASCIVPMNILAYPEVTGEVVDTLVWNVLIAVVVVLAVGMVLPAPQPLAVPLPRIAVVAPPVAAVVLAGSAFLAWVFEPPAPGALLIGVVLTLRADIDPGLRVVRDRMVAALLGGGLAVVAATVMALAPVLPTLFLVMAVLGWPLAVRAVQPGPWRGAAMKSLFALAILTGEGFSLLFEDTAERLGIRIVGVLIGVGIGAATIALFGQDRPRLEAA